MITRANPLLSIEGPIVAPDEVGRTAKVRRRIEIDTRSGRIASVAEPESTAPAADLVLDGSYTIFPGFVDWHVHSREDVTGAQSYKEDFRTAGEAAIHGGVVAFAEMPNTPEPPVDDASYAARRELVTHCAADVLLYAGIGPTTRPLSFPVPYKAYMGPSIGELFFRDEESLRHALARYRGQFVAFHAELPEVLRRHQNAPSHAERRPPEAEVGAIELALRLSENYGLEAHICHLSTADGLELIRSARRRGQPVTCEVTPHHLYYDLDNAESFARPGYLQCNPPIRTRLDRIALLEGLKSGDIDFLATDHAPHSLDEKDRGTSGVTHLDTYGPFASWLVEEGFSLRDVERVCAEAPGRLLSRFLPRRYGKIAVGYAGSLTILEDRAVTIRRDRLRTRAGWSAFEGRSFAAQVRHTVVRGRIHTLEVSD